MSKKSKRGVDPKPIQKENFDKKIRPQDDFYRFANGNWLKNNVIPKNQNSWGSFSILRQNTFKRLNTILKKLSSDGSLKKRSDEEKMANLYLSSLNMAKRNRQDTKYLQNSFQKISSIKTKDELTSVLGYLHLIGVDAPWSLWFDQDEKDCKRMVLRISNGDIGVPDRDYYIKNTKETRRVLTAYKKYTMKLMRVEGLYKGKTLESISKTIFKIEKRLAKATPTATNRRDAHKTYNKMSKSKLQKEYPAINWSEYFDILSIPKNAQRHIIVDHPYLLKEINKILLTEKLDRIKEYLHWSLLNSYAGTLGQKYLDVQFEYYGKTIQGIKRPTENWKKATYASTSYMPDLISKLYVKKHFSSSSKKDVEKIITNLISAYKKRISDLDWMSTKTKTRALKKLGTMRYVVGYPNKWQPYGALKIGSESYTKNIMQANIFNFRLWANKLSKPTDRNEMEMAPATVNACYSPNLNKIVFPAAILQPPFFYSDADDAINYGAIGYIIGHEMTHGFDDNGSHFDENGNLNDWWTKSDRKEFDKRTNCLVKQFGSYSIADGVKVNGKLTLGENIADLGGLIISYEAFKISLEGKRRKLIDGLTEEERFFISFATQERSLTRDEFIKMIALTDPHSPGEFRTNGSLINIEAFHEIFNTKPGDKLYKKKTARIKIW